MEQWSNGNIMNVSKQNLEKSQVELNVELTNEEFKPYITEATQKVSEETEVEGFRPGKAPYDVLAQKVGEMTILERAARLAVNATVDQAISENLESQPVGQPRVDITQLAPGEPVQYKVVVAMLPEVKLGEYKNMDVEPEQVEVTDQEVEDTLENLKERQATEKSVDRAVQEGDKAVIDIDMYQNDVPVEGGQSRDTTIVVGQKNLVPGFDDELIGAKKNEERKFTLTYPEEHHQKNLAGQNVDFKVVVKEIYERELPEINDEFAQKMGVNSLEELKKMVKDSLASQKQEEAQQKTESKLVDKVIENSQFGDIPDVLANNEAETMMNEMEQTVQNQGGTFEDYLSSIGKSREQLMLDLAPDAIKRVKSALIIREIANQENIEVTEEEVDQKQNELLEQYKGYQKVEERVKQDSYRQYLQNIIANRKVIDKLKEWNLPEEEGTKAAQAAAEANQQEGEGGEEVASQQEAQQEAQQEETSEQKDSSAEEQQEGVQQEEPKEEEGGKEQAEEEVSSQEEESGQEEATEEQEGDEGESLEEQIEQAEEEYQEKAEEGQQEQAQPEEGQGEQEEEKEEEKKNEGEQE